MRRDVLLLALLLTLLLFLLPALLVTLLHIWAGEVGLLCCDRHVLSLRGLGEAA